MDNGECAGALVKEVDGSLLGAGDRPQPAIGFDLQPADPAIRRPVRKLDSRPLGPVGGDECLEFRAARLAEPFLRERRVLPRRCDIACRNTVSDHVLPIFQSVIVTAERLQLGGQERRRVQPRPGKFLVRWRPRVFVEEGGLGKLAEAGTGHHLKQRGLDRGSRPARFRQPSRIHKPCARLHRPRSINELAYEVGSGQEGPVHRAHLQLGDDQLDRLVANVRVGRPLQQVEEFLEDFRGQGRTAEFFEQRLRRRLFGAAVFGEATEVARAVAAFFIVFDLDWLRLGQPAARTGRADERSGGENDGLPGADGDRLGRARSAGGDLDAPAAREPDAPGAVEKDRGAHPAP